MQSNFSLPLMQHFLVPGRPLQSSGAQFLSSLSAKQSSHPGPTHCSPSQHRTNPGTAGGLHAAAGSAAPLEEDAELAAAPLEPPEDDAPPESSSPTNGCEPPSPSSNDTSGTEEHAPTDNAQRAQKPATRIAAT